MYEYITSDTFFNLIRTTLYPYANCRTVTMLTLFCVKKFEPWQKHSVAQYSDHLRAWIPTLDRCRSSGEQLMGQRLGRWHHIVDLIQPGEHVLFIS